MYFLPTNDANVDTKSTDVDSSLRCGSESSCFGVAIWDFGFSIQKCPDRLSGHTIQSLSQTLRMKRKPFRKREKDKVSERTHNIVSPLAFYFNRVFIVFKGRGHSSVVLALDSTS